MKNLKSTINRRLNSNNRNQKRYEKFINKYKLLLFVAFILLISDINPSDKLIDQNIAGNDAYQENGICLKKYSVNESTGNVYIYVQCYLDGDPGRDFCQKSNIPYADASTFEVIEFPYSKDCNNVYFLSKKIENADVKTFQIIEKGFSKDNYNVYAAAKIIVNADPKTISIVDDFDRYHNFYIKDKNFLYYCITSGRSEVIAGVDSRSFIFLNKTYAKDKNRVYCRRHSTGKINHLQGADPKTFEAIDMWSGKDKNNLYKKCSVKN